MLDTYWPIRASGDASGASSDDAPPPSEAPPEVAREDMHEGERKLPPVNALLFVELHDYIS